MRVQDGHLIRNLLFATTAKPFQAEAHAASNRFDNGCLCALQNVPTNPTLERKYSRFRYFNFSASHDHFGMAVWAGRHRAAKGGDKLIFGNGDARFLHEAYLWVQIFRNI